MRLVLMNGGLGNQAFQYIFTRYLEEKTGEQCIVDDLWFHRPMIEHNGYELEKIFSIKHPCLSDYLGEEMTHRICNLLWPTGTIEKNQKYDQVTILKECGLDLMLIQEGNFFLQDYQNYRGKKYSTVANAYVPDILNIKGDLYYYGYWINGRWFGSILDKMVQEFTFPPLPDPQNQAFLSEIVAAGDRSVAVHIRRGAFVQTGWVLPPEYYQKAFVAFREAIEQPKFFLFSDDIAWVKANRKELGIVDKDDCTFIEGNMDGNNYIDMQLMLACRGMIIANSAFSYLAALLNRRPDRIVSNPTAREIL